MALKLTDFVEGGLEDIPLSTPTRVTHRGCSDKANATVTRTPLGWLMHCFKCDERGFKYARVGKLPGSMVYAPTTTNVNPPSDILFRTSGNPEWNTRLVEYGINPTDLRTTTLGWSVGTHRLMFPLGKVMPADGEYKMFSSKSFAGKLHPKEVVVGGTKWIVYKHGEDKDSPLVFCHGFGSGVWDKRTIVLCEDPISALKIGGNGLGFGAIAVLGLSLPQELLVYLAAKEVPDLIVWSDGDAPGMKRGRGIYDQLKFLKRNTYFTYVKGKDPKDLTIDQIRDHIASVRKETVTVA